MKIGVSSYSFSRLVGSGQMKQIDVVSKAKEMGFDVIEFIPFGLDECDTKEEMAQKLSDECKKVGIEMGTYAVGADFLNGSDGDLDAEIAKVKAEIDIARILGAKAVRHDATGGYPIGHTGARGFDDVLPILVKAYTEITEYAAQFGIKTMVENHGYFCQDSDRVEKLINGVNNSNFGLLMDIGNFVCVDEEPNKAVGKLVPYVFHVHAKDFHIKSGMEPNPGTGWFKSRGGNYLRGAIVGHGCVPVKQCFDIIKNSGYDDTISLEFEGMEDPLVGIQVGLENIKRYL